MDLFNLSLNTSLLKKKMMPELLINVGLTLIFSVILFFGLPAFFSVAAAYWLCLLISAVIVFGGFLILTEGDFIDL